MPVLFAQASAVTSGFVGGEVKPCNEYGCVLYETPPGGICLDGGGSVGGAGGGGVIGGDNGGGDSGSNKGGKKKKK